MSRYNPFQQDVNDQYNAGEDVVIDSNGRERIVRGIRPSCIKSLWRDEYSIEFCLSSCHVIVFTIEESGLLSRASTLYVDRQKVLSRRTGLHSTEKIEHFFKLEEVDCEFSCRLLVGFCDGRVRIGGKEITAW
jgi:hypothetical protein